MWCEVKWFDLLVVIIVVLINCCDDGVEVYFSLCDDLIKYVDLDMVWIIVGVLVVLLELV